MSDRADPFARMDQRARRTRTLLAEALMSLGARDAEIDALDVGDLAREAGVSRSTFYQHFASKDDFMVRSFVEMIAATEAAHAARYPSRTDILPSRALFTHIAGASGLARAVTRSGIYARQLAAAEIRLRAIAETNLARRCSSWSVEQRREAAVFIAGGFVGLLRWWMESGLRQSPERMQTAFEQLTERALDAQRNPSLS